jgi:hypothetical protein
MNTTPLQLLSLSALSFLSSAVYAGAGPLVPPAERGGMPVSGAPVSGGPELSPGAGSGAFDGEIINADLAEDLAAASGETLLDWARCSDEAGIRLEGECITLVLQSGEADLTTVTLSSETCASGDGCFGGYSTVSQVEASSWVSGSGYGTTYEYYVGVKVRRTPGTPSVGTEVGLVYTGMSDFELEMPNSSTVIWSSYTYDADGILVDSDGAYIVASSLDGLDEKSCEQDQSECMAGATDWAAWYDFGGAGISLVAGGLVGVGVWYTGIGIPVSGTAAGATSASVLLLSEKFSAKQKAAMEYQCVVEYGDCKLAEATDTDGDEPPPSDEGESVE